jgi:hypothetical protein
MKLWTIQPIEWYERLLTEKIIYGERKYVDSYFLCGYEWLVKVMEERIGKRPSNDSFPVWAWYQYLTTKKIRPDLRESGYLRKGETGVRIEIEKNENEVLLSDYDLWHSPLGNFFYIGESEKDTLKFDKMLKNKKLDKVDFEKLPIKIRKRIEESWLKVFDMNYDCPYFAREKKDKSIQATFWSLSLDEVVKVDKFVAR